MTTPTELNTVLKIQIAKLLACNLFVSADPRRYYLHGIFVTHELGKLVLVATDNHRLIKFTCDECEEFDPFIIPHALIAGIKKVRGIDKCTITKSGIALSVEYANTNNGGEIVNGTFPDYNRTFPGIEREPIDCLGINPSFLVDFAKVDKLLGTRIPAIRMEFYGYGAPVLVSNPANGYTGLVMPLRV